MFVTANRHNLKHALKYMRCNYDTSLPIDTMDMRGQQKRENEVESPLDVHFRLDKRWAVSSNTGIWSSYTDRAQTLRSLPGAQRWVSHVRYIT